MGVRFNYRGKVKHKPIKPIPPPEVSDTTQCVCGAVVPLEEVEEHRLICDEPGEDEPPTVPDGDS